MALNQQPCLHTYEKFEGKVESSGNEIYDNGEVDMCPEDLKFLMTEEGGVLDWRE